MAGGADRDDPGRTIPRFRWTFFLVVTSQIALFLMLFSIQVLFFDPLEGLKS